MSKRKAKSTCLGCGERLQKDGDSAKYCADCLEITEQERAKAWAMEQKERRKVSRE